MSIAAWGGGQVGGSLFRSIDPMEAFEPGASPHGHLLLSRLEGHIRQAATPGGPRAHALHLSPSNTMPWPLLFGLFFSLPGTTCKGNGLLGG